MIPLIDANSTHKTFSTKSKQNPVLAVSADAPITLDAETAATTFCSVCSVNESERRDGSCQQIKYNSNE
jgi:hypothetical protein